MSGQTQYPVGFVLPPGTPSNATNLQTPGYIIETSADPWATCCPSPWDDYPNPDQQTQFYQLLDQRYGQPTSGVVPIYGQTSMHITDFQYALQNIAQQDPGWFSREGYGPGPGSAPPSQIFPTQAEAHDAQYAYNICNQVLSYSAQLNGVGGTGSVGAETYVAAGPGVGFILPSGAQSNATNLQSYPFTINASVNPWGFLNNPYGVPNPQQQSEWIQLVGQRYGQPVPGDVLPYPGGAYHSTDFQAALTAIADLDPGWFQKQGYGPGPRGLNGKPTQLEVHDAQYAQGISNEIIRYAAQIQKRQGRFR